MFPRCQCLLKRQLYRYLPNKEGLSLVRPIEHIQNVFGFLAALVDPSGLARPFLRFSSGPAGGLFVGRLLLLTCVQCCSSTAWAEAG